MAQHVCKNNVSCAGTRSAFDKLGAGPFKGFDPFDKFMVEYALRDVRKPIGVAGWEATMVETLPRNLKGCLPTVEEIEAELRTKERKGKSRRA